MTAAALDVGVLGLGPGGLAMLPYLASHPHARLAAVCDIRPQAALPDGLRAARYRHAQELFESGIDAVFIATPTRWHAEHAIQAMRAGLHVIVEKPMCLTPDEADAMIAAARRYGRQLVVGHSHSFEPAIQLMRAAIVSGRYGALKAINAWNYTDWMYRGRLPEEFDRAAGGGVVFRQGVHHADMVRYLAGDSPASIRAVIGDWDRRRPGDGSYTAFATFPDNVAVSLFYSGYDHFPATELSFGIGENGSPAPAGYALARRSLYGADDKHRAGLAAQMARLTPGRHPAFFGILIASCEGADLRIDPEGVRVYGDDACLTLPVAGLPLGRHAVLDELLAAIDGRPPVHGPQWGKANLAFCDAMVESSLRSAEVILPRDAPEPAVPVLPPSLVMEHFRSFSP
ncbi:hypothetical protein CDO44_10445 [Pigmentiphaga sp. NML080357]|uniref:Gfo/Idh/MocA family protein n=1 Tax=unclassified Pigmentiphaga TaxID=2626614 RepID=UPI000B41E859|nr:Gfo/Idh/MocA family oxidoreductase [Pigmentiphaga sp. NML080357]OVZ59975.1 hypothetical protein CDO44_10445 [Pigmentiphaga sp. NML080357]